MEIARVRIDAEKELIGDEIVAQSKLRSTK